MKLFIQVCDLQDKRKDTGLSFTPIPKKEIMKTPSHCPSLPNRNNLIALLFLIIVLFHIEECAAQKDTIYNISKQDEENFKMQIHLLDGKINIETHPLLHTLSDTSWNKTANIKGEGIIIKMKSGLYWRTDSVAPNKPPFFTLKNLMPKDKMKPDVLHRSRYNQLITEYRNKDNIESICAYSFLLDTTNSKNYKTKFVFKYNDSSQLVLRDKFLAPAE